MKNILTIMLLIMLCACASAEFPELEESSGSVIESDSKNAVYEDIKPQPTKPVKVVETKQKSKAFVDNKKDKPKEKVAKKIENKTEKKPVQEIAVQEPKNEYNSPSIEVLMATVYFGDGASFVDSSEKQIRDVAKFVKNNNAKVKVLGHSSSRTLNTDPVSHKMANFDASLKRAQNTAKALEKAGVKKQDIMVEALSDSRPAYLEVMPEGERLNRRAEIYVIY